MQSRERGCQLSHTLIAFLQSNILGFLICVLAILAAIYLGLVLSSELSHPAFPDHRRRHKLASLFSILNPNSRATDGPDVSANGPRQVRCAYETDKNTPFYITSVHLSRLILPPSTLHELSRLPASVASLRENFVDRYAGKWTGFDVILESSLFSDVVRVGLTQNLDALLPHLRRELQHGLADHLGQAKAPISVFISDLVLDLSLRMTAFVLVGAPLCHDPKFFSILKSYPSSIDTIAKQFNHQPHWLRPFLAMVSRPLAHLRHMQAELEGILEPAIHNIRSRTSANDSDGGNARRANDMTETAPFNVLDVLARRCASTRKIGLQLMFLSLAAVSTSAGATTQVILQMAERPNWSSQLRQELKLTRSSDKDLSNPSFLDGIADCPVTDVKGLKSMVKLDAFIKETIRMHMPGWTSFMRKTLQPFTLIPPPRNATSGTGEPIKVPAHIMVCVATAAMSRDPDYFIEPDSFDPSRFMTTTAQTVRVLTKSLGHTVTSDQDEVDALPHTSLTGLDARMPIWGLGRWSCPGRFYAELQIKLIAVEILGRWDLSLLKKGRDFGGTSALPGVVTSETTEAEKVNTGDRNLPDPMQKLIFVRRTEVVTLGHANDTSH